mmetsp:Transcript_13089/g.40864  ORF Transcript_13089/g.40864 Transcript_13089/m.40864 type:complete len:252 (-) Transcript_13089:1159-1914(-)
MNRKLASGLLGSASPARLRCTASATAVTAALCPSTRAPKTSSSLSSLSRSDCMSFDTGMPVQRQITSPMSASVTSSATLRPPPLPEAAAASSATSSLFCRLMSCPYLSSAALDRSYSRSACAMATLVLSISSLISDTRATAPRASSHSALITDCSAFMETMSESSRARRALDAAPVSLRSESRSISICTSRRSRSSSARGLLVSSILSLAAASSTTSMALSGRNRSEMYLSASVAASTSAASEMRTPWCTS